MPATAEPESRRRGPVLTLRGHGPGRGGAPRLPRHPEWVESFYRPRVYGAVRASVHRLCALAPFSVAQGLVVLLVWALCAGFRHLRRSGVRALPGLCCAPCAAPPCSTRCTLCSGGAAWRPTLAQRWGSRAGRKTSWVWPMSDGSVARRPPGLDREGIFPPGGRWTASRSHPPGPRARPARCSRSSPGRCPRCGASPPRVCGPAWHPGIFVPFTGEPHVNAEALAVRQPFHALHEIAHARGIVREDEANFVAWWIAVHSGDPHLRYAANLVAWEHALVALSIVDTPAAKEMAGRLTPEIRADRKAVTEYWRQFEGPLEAVGRRTNDLFLKSQGQTHGVASYGRMLQLLLAERAHRLAPTPPPENVSRSGAGQGL
ncbi:MAG: DUF3810 family protein [Planctomycetota bacterium]